jgi:hypothetical protein
MTEHALRFGVTTTDGRRAESWKCWTLAGTGKRDVYFTCRALGHSLKLSLHESGRWHVAFDSKRLPHLFEAESVPAKRFLGKFDRPAPLAERLTLACRVYVPWLAVTMDPRSGDNKIHWVETAPQEHAIEFSLFLVDHPPHPTQWPGQNAMETSLIGWIPVEGGSSACVVYRTCLYQPGQLPPLPAPQYFKGASEEDLLTKGNRAVLWGSADDGSVVFHEGPIKITKHGGG